MSMTTTEKKRRCVGCRSNFYNGNNNLGVTECWSLEKAKTVWKKLVPVDQRPPWTQKARRILSCYRPPRTVAVEPHQTC